MQEAILISSTASKHDQIGRSVDIVGNTLLVGAPGAIRNSGAVYTYQWDGANWGETFVLVANVQVDNEFFGDSIALGVNDIVVGSPRDDTGGANAGAAYVTAY